MNFCWLRFAICAAVTADSGTAMRAMTANTGEITNIITSTPITVSTLLRI